MKSHKNFVKMEQKKGAKSAAGLAAVAGGQSSMSSKMHSGKDETMLIIYLQCPSVRGCDPGQA